MKDSRYDFIYEQEMHHWWYRVRRELVGKIVHTYEREKVGPLKILDIGCGAGALMQELAVFGEVSGVDISPRAIEYCKARGITRVQEADAAKLPFPDESFDVVVMLDVLEHLPDDNDGANEVARVLKKDGLAIIAVPAFMFLWGVTDVVSHHFRRYRRPELVRALKSAELSVKYAGYFNTFLFPLIALVRFAVRFLKLPMENEQGTGGKIGNAICYAIFSLESKFIPTVRFPFGVSILALARKGV
jgi:SAM-dependent methyltransferase